MAEQKPLSQFIEKIIENGSLTRDDQNEINKLAMQKTFSDVDSQAVSKLTMLISEGRVNVQN